MDFLSIEGRSNKHKPMDGHPSGGAPPKGKYITAGPDISFAGLVAVRLYLSRWFSMHFDSFELNKHASNGLGPN